MKLKKLVPFAWALVRAYKNPLVPAGDLAGLLERGRRARVALRCGATFELRTRTSDVRVLNEVFVRKIYDSVLGGVHEGSMVLDIGAHIGAFAVAAGLRGASVVSFEPIRENFDLLVRNVALNNLRDRVVARNAAVGKASGELALFGVTDDTGGSTAVPLIHPEWWAGGKLRDCVRVVRVPCESFDKVVGSGDGPMWDCVKIDCEGMEYEISEAADRATLKRIRALVLEFHPNGDVAALERVCCGAGFRVRIDAQHSLLMARRETSSADGVVGA